jgi:four helix bundle protein
MAGVQRFEDLVAWQKAREFTRQVYTVTRHDNFARDYALCDQMRRAAVSVMANVAEGFGRNSPSEFHHFLLIAVGSCQELRSHLYVALDCGYLADTEFQDLMTKVVDLGRTLNALRMSVANNRDKQLKKPRT